MIALVLGFAGSAQAEQKVDWSSYLEPPGSHPKLATPPAAKPVATSTPAKKVAKPAPKATPKRKPVARAKHR